MESAISIRPYWIVWLTTTFQPRRFILTQAAISCERVRPRAKKTTFFFDESSAPARG
jgi:hypothetical protein